MGKLTNLLPQAAAVRDATEEYENSASRVGSLFVSIIQAIIDTVPEALIDGSTVSFTTSESNFIISMKKRLDDGSLVPITITIPAASTANAGLLTPALLAELRAGINSASNAAATAQNGANSANRTLSEVITSISTMRDGMATIETKVIEHSTNIEGLSSEVSNIFEQIGKPFGIAPLDALGKVPATHLPPLALGYTEDSAFPGNEGKELREIVERLENDLNDSSSVGNIFNVTVEAPIDGYYTLCDTVNPQLSAVHAAWEKGKAVNGLIISFEMSAGNWKTYQYVGKAKTITQEAWVFPDNWTDFGSLAAGSENFIVVDNIIPRKNGYYGLESALYALENYEEQTGVIYRKEGLVITYRSAERTFETKQFTGSLNDIYTAPALWKDFGGGGQTAEIEVTDTPSEGSTKAFSAGGAFGHLPVNIDLDAETEGVVKLQLRNEKGDAIGDQIQFAVGTGSGDSGTTIVAVAFKDSPLYGAYGSVLSSKVAIRSVTSATGIEQDNIIERIEILDRDSGVLLSSKKVNAPSSSSLEDYSFEIDFSDFFTSAGARRFRITAYDDTGASGSKNITVTAVDVTCTCTQTLQYNPANPVTTTTEVAHIPLFKFANNQGEISTQVDIKIGNEWRPLTTVVVNDTYSHNIQLQPVALGLSHGSYPIRIQGTDVASGTKGNTVYTAIMVLEYGNSTPLVALRYDDRNDGKIKVYETLSLDIACYNPIATQTHVNIMLNNEQISQVLALNTRSYTFSQQVKGFSNGDSLAYQLVAGDSYSDTVNLLVNGSVIDAELTAGAIYSFDFASRSNDEPSHTIESNGYTMEVIGSNWRSNGFANFLGENSLRIAENVKATIPHAPFAPSSLEATGMALQFTFATSNVKNNEARLMECYDENSGAGFYVTGNEVAIFCKNGVRSVSKKRFESGTKVTVAVVAEPASVSYERKGTYYSLFALYVNGEWCGTIGYPTGANNLFQERNITFDGTQGDFYLYNISAWGVYFEWAQAFKNYLVKKSDTKAMVEEFDFENVLISQSAEGANALRPSAAELYARGIPYIVENDDDDKFNAFDSGTDTGENFEMKGLYYYNPLMPWRSFFAPGTRKRRQGTTSAKRPKKNPRYYLNKASEIRPLFPEYTNEDALLTYELFKQKKVRVGENTIPVDLITVKIDFSDASGVNDCGTCDMMNNTYRALGAEFLTPAQRFFNHTYDLGDIHIEDLQLNHSTANHPVAVYRTNSDSLENVYFEAKGNWKEDKNEQTALGFMNTPGYNKGCMNYQDESFIEFIGADGETLDDVKQRFLETANLDTSMPYLLSLYCGRNYKFMRYKNGAWTETTGSMRQVNGKWVIEGDVLNPVEGFELLIYQDMCWWRGVASVEDLMAPSTMKASWVQKLIDKGSVSSETVPAWTYYFEPMVDNDQLAIAYATGNKVPYQLLDMLVFCNSCDSTVTDAWADNWKNNLHLHANPRSIMSYYGFTDYACGKDQQAKNMQPMWFIEDGASVINGEYSENALIMYLNKIYDADGVNDKDNDGGCDTDPEVDPGKPTTETYTNPFAGWNSILWVCCREQQEVLLANGTPLSLRTVISAMRNCQCEVDGRGAMRPFSPEGAIYFYCTKRQLVWPKVVSSYDGFRKYVQYTATSDTLYFYALQGLGLTSLPAFIRSRWRIRDGYYQTGDFFSGVLSGRIACASDATIKIKASAAGYFGVGNDASGNLSESCYLEAGQEYTFSNFKKDNGTLLYIYQADRIAEIDLSDLSLSENFDFSVMKLVEKIVTGSALHSELSMGYAPLTSYMLGELPFLKSIDVRGTSATVLDASRCPRIEQIIATNSALQNLTLAETSPINDIALPTTMTEMRIVGLPNLKYMPTGTSGLRISSMPKVVKVWVESSPNFNAMLMVAHIVQSQVGERMLAMVRIVNQSNLTGNGNELKALIEQRVGGMDIDGNKTEKPVIEGEYLITSILEEYEIAAIEAGIEGITIVEGLSAYVGIVNEVNAESYSGDADADIDVITIENVGDYIYEYNRETYDEYLENFATENADINEFINL